MWRWYDDNCETVPRHLGICAISRLHNHRLHSISAESRDCTISFACTIISQRSCVKNDVMLLFTRTTGERCSLPKYSIHMFSQFWWNQSLHLMHWAIFLRSCWLPARAVYLDFQLLNYLFGPMLETVPHPASCQRHAWGQKFGDCTISRLCKRTAQSWDWCAISGF